MIKFVFEDYIDNVLPKFYRRYYGNKNNLIWTSSNSRMWTRVRDNPVLGDDYEILFLDFNPWNKNIVILFNLMSKQIRRKGYHYIIIPIVCSEYKYLISLDDKYLVNKDIIRHLIGITSSSEFVDKSKNVITYEDYCKCLAEECVVDIAKLCIDNMVEPVYCIEDTLGDSLYSKWLSFIFAFDVFPIIEDKSLIDITVSKSIVQFSINDLLLLQKNRCLLCNQWIDSVNINYDLHLNIIEDSWYK